MRFDEASWIKKLGFALESVAAAATPQYETQSIRLRGSLPIQMAESIRHREYRSLAARAKHDAKALQQFNNSHLWVRTDPVEARAILSEHPLVKRCLDLSGGKQEIVIRILNQGYGTDLAWLVNSMAKLSVKEGGEGAAERLNRFLTTVEDECIPADEIIVFHGLNVKERVDLGQGAYFAPYESAKLEFGLPEEPEPFGSTSTPNVAVLVRSLECGPEVDSPNSSFGLPNTLAKYSFPSDYCITIDDWFDDDKFLIDILSVAARVPLLSRTRYVQFHKWIREIDPKLSHPYRTSEGYTSDWWPKGRDLLQSDVENFIALAGDWYTKKNKPYALRLAIRRLASSFSRPVGRFLVEDRILDVAIALEILYGDRKGHMLAKRAARLLGEGAEEQIHTYGIAMHFYNVSSKIVHSKHPTPNRESFYDELVAGQDLACRSLSSLLRHSIPTDWSRLQPYLHPAAEEHIQKMKPR